VSAHLVFQTGQRHPAAVAVAAAVVVVDALSAFVFVDLLNDAVVVVDWDDVTVAAVVGLCVFAVDRQYSVTVFEFEVDPIGLIAAAERLVVFVLFELLGKKREKESKKLN
jgi:uncharacterized membrane protein (DUF373 family)